MNKNTQNCHSQSEHTSFDNVAPRLVVVLYKPRVAQQYTQPSHEFLLAVNTQQRQTTNDTAKHSFQDSSFTCNELVSVCQIHCQHSAVTGTNYFFTFIALTSKAQRCLIDVSHNR